MTEPTRTEDAKNLSIISGAALVGLLCTVALVANAVPHRHRVRVVEIAGQPSAASPRLQPVEGPAMEGRLYGTVITRRGEEFTGYIRWDRNEGSWVDLLDADRKGQRSALTSIRFGHVESMQVLNSHEALFTLKSGQVQRLGSRRTDLGRGLRSIVVEDAREGMVELEWGDVETVDFEAAPVGAPVVGKRLYGTLVTRAGLEFTGHVSWDLDEILTTDVLDGDDINGRRLEIAFGDVTSIQRESSRASRVVLNDGRDMVLRGTNDVDRDNRGISVSDPALGQVTVSWNDFAAVHFDEPPMEIGYAGFDGGRRIRGTVTTESGEALSGDVRWDNDEEFTWEMLDGDYKGIEFKVEFSRIASITKRAYSATVVLLDGRSFQLEGGNDVNPSNRGVTVSMEDGSVHVLDWDDFREFRLEH